MVLVKNLSNTYEKIGSKLASSWRNITRLSTWWSSLAPFSKEDILIFYDSLCQLSYFSTTWKTLFFCTHYFSHNGYASCVQFSITKRLEKLHPITSVKMCTRIFFKQLDSYVREYVMSESSSLYSSSPIIISTHRNPRTFNFAKLFV